MNNSAPSARRVCVVALGLWVALALALAPRPGGADNAPPLGTGDGAAPVDGGSPTVPAVPPAPSATQEAPVQNGVPLDNPSGWFFAGATDDLGYAIIDDPGGAPFWSAYQRLGGIAILGLPISRPFLLPDSRAYQVCQFGMLVWRAGAATAERADLLDMLAAAGLDDWLLARGIPRADRESPVLTRLGWLSDETIRGVYFGADNAPSTLPAAAPSDAVARFGLPASRPITLGRLTVQRFQRGALRVVLGADGTVAGVEQVAVGDLLRESGLLTTTVLAPNRLVDGELAPHGARPQLAWRSDTGWGAMEITRSDQSAAVAGTVPSPAAPPPTASDAAVAVIPAAVSSIGPASTSTPGPPFAPTTTPPSAERAAPTARPPTSTPRPTATNPAATATTQPAAPQPGARIVIRDIVNQGRAEHVVVANTGTAAQDLTGWTLRSVNGNQSLAFPAGYVLGAGASVNVHSGSGDAATLNRPPSDLYLTRSNVWNNDGDQAQIVDPSGRVVAELRYGSP